VDLTSTATSCGSCGNVCSAGLDCVAGKCKATQCSAANEGKPCIEGTLTGTCCSSACVDLATDENNCGHCDTACPSILTCANYGCGLDSCDATQNGLPCHLGTSHQLGQCCQSACVDTQSDPANCNGCGLPCPNGKQCVAGSCK
jgi:hypothetical protein